jgi:cytochrome c oxidase assembly protein Cox11
VLFLASKPFNLFCSLTNKCEPFYLSYLIPKKEGSVPIKINFEITNYLAELEFEPAQPTLTTVANRKNVVLYTVKNNSNNPIKFHPELLFEPEDLDEYFVLYECLCEKSYQLKPGQKLQLKMIFLLDPEIEKTKKDDSDLVLKVRYKI